LFEYSLDPNDEDAHILKEDPKDYSPLAIVGIRPCDAQAFLIVKRNFDNAEYRDPWWVQHYESTVLVGMGCNEPCSTCFCTTANNGPFHEEGLDALIGNLGECFFVKAVTEKFFLKVSPATDEALNRYRIEKKKSVNLVSR